MKVSKPAYSTSDQNTNGSALGWLEYCNSDRNTYYANMRRKNGREKPYNVRDSSYPGYTPPI